MAAGSASDPRSPDSTVRRAVAALAVGALVAFGVVAASSTFLAKQIARDEELAEATRSGNMLVRTVLAGSIQAFVDGDGQAGSALDEAVRLRRSSGSAVYLMIRTGDGRVIYPADREATGQLKSPGTATPPSETTAAVVAADEARSEIGAVASGRMVRVDVPVRLSDGTTAMVFVYSTDDQLRISEEALSVKLVVLSTGAVSLLLLLNLPVSIGLLHRVGKAHREHVRMLFNEVAAVDRERRNVARDLHDGVIQDLAGARYALDALKDEFQSEADEPAQRMLDLSHDAVRRSMQALRTLIIDVAPPDLASDGLPTAIEVLVKRLSNDHRIDVDVAIDLGRSVDGQIAALVYRAVRECLTNIVKHARATHARITIRSDISNVYVVAEDDGDGFPADLDERRRDGHMGLSLLAGTIADLGGRLTIDDREDGAAVRCLIPIG